MANIILPAVPVLNEIDDSTKLLIEQAGEINRYPISDLDIGGGDVTIDLNSPGGDSTNTGNPINADTLGGKPASDYVLKDELILDGVGGGGEGDITIEIDPSAKEKPQSPLYSTSNDTHFYPLTTADQVILDDGNRLDDEISKYLTVKLEGEAAEPNSINADTLGGYAAEEYVRKDQYGIELNYSVVGSMEEPMNPTQNMIWIQTETPIGRVFFGNDEPNETFMEGDVWITTGSSSSVAFNSLRIGNSYMDMVCPIFVKQCVGGVLMDVTAMSYQNGEWNKWSIYLYNAGNEYSSITGGLITSSWRTFTNVTATNPTLSYNSDNIEISLTGWGIGGCIRTNNKIDLADKKKLRFRVDIPNANGIVNFVVATGASNNDLTTVANAMIADEAVTNHEVNIDVSNCNDSYYICVEICAYNDNTKICKIYEIEVI